MVAVMIVGVVEKVDVEQVVGMRVVTVVAVVQGNNNFAVTAAAIIVVAAETIKPHPVL